nr:excalibur calcium-binding domain-containing protein [Rhodococcus rhodochrous]
MRTSRPERHRSTRGFDRWTRSRAACGRYGTPFGKELVKSPPVIPPWPRPEAIAASPTLLQYTRPTTASNRPTCGHRRHRRCHRRHRHCHRPGRAAEATFAAHILTAALAPTNYLWTNPAHLDGDNDGIACG